MDIGNATRDPFIDEVVNEILSAWFDMIFGTVITCLSLEGDLTQDETDGRKDGTAACAVIKVR